jgi:type II secretory pathway predicted ATPase ExeA
VLYLCDTAVAPLDLYRTLATEIGVKPSHRRAQLWSDIKKTLVHMVDERGTAPVLVLDEAQHLSDSFLVDLSGFLNFAFDSRDLITLWLVGLPALSRHLRMQIHAPLAMRIVHQVHLEPLDRDLFAAMIDHGLKAAGATQTILADPAKELLFRASRGVPRVASSLLRQALREAHEKNQNFVDDHTMEVAIDASPPVQAVKG